MKKILNTDWLRAVQSFRNAVPKNEIQCQKMKYSANFIDYKIQPFLAENNTKNPNIYKWQKLLVFEVDFILLFIILKLTI